MSKPEPMLVVLEVIIQGVRTPDAWTWADGVAVGLQTMLNDGRFGKEVTVAVQATEARREETRG